MDGDEFEKAYAKAETSFQAVKDRSGPGAEWLGWRDLLEDPNDAELEQLDIICTTSKEGGARPA